MLGLIGFLFAALAIMAFVMSYRNAFAAVDGRTTRSVTTAFSLLAVVMLVCAVAVASPEKDTQFFILLVDVLMLVATGYMLHILFDMRLTTLVVVYALLAGVVITFRAFVMLPAAFVENGLLHFNLEGLPRFVLLGVILFVWLPAMIAASLKAVKSIRTPHLATLYSVLYAIPVITATAFFSTRQENMIIVTFASLIASFALLAAANVLSSRLTHLVEQGGARHGK